jgi:hypothetical protein
MRRATDRGSTVAPSPPRTALAIRETDSTSPTTFAAVDAWAKALSTTRRMVCVEERHVHAPRHEGLAQHTPEVLVDVEEDPGVAGPYGAEQGERESVYRAVGSQPDRDAACQLPADDLHVGLGLLQLAEDHPGVR